MPVETARAFGNLEDILAAPGETRRLYQACDLTLGLRGRKYAPGPDEEPEMIDAIKHILDRAHKGGGNELLFHGGTAITLPGRVGARLIS